MSKEPVAWKAYEEVHFNDQYILRWVREGDEYVNKITKKMMEDLQAVVRKQYSEIEALKKELNRTKFAWNMAENELERYLLKVKAQEK